MSGDDGSHYEAKLRECVERRPSIEQRIEKAKEGVYWVMGCWCIINEECFIWKKNIKN
tara:strand:+ start:489 stop:662 length:174 start_codon:yes stop_codon:yes gene_type:complete